jgi:hypothetical protein
MSLLRHLLTQPRFWRRLLLERATEPLHLNLLSLLAAAFGTTRAKVLFDVLVRQQHAYAMLWAADAAASRKLRGITIVELGVGAGAGLMNLCELAERMSKLTGVEINVVGFDTGAGMPAPRDYRDHPELYQRGWFPMDQDKLVARLPPFARLILGDIEETVPRFVEGLSPSAPIGFVSLDVDYYSSSCDALKVLLGRADCYLPVVPMYVDDISLPSHNPACGELLALRDFNEAYKNRFIAFHDQLYHSRVFKHAEWLSHMYNVHVLDHPERNVLERGAKVGVLPNPYL